MLGRLLAVAYLIALAAPAAAAPAGCSEMVADARAWLAAHPQVSGTRRQTVEAQLQHQPSAASVARAKMESRDHIVVLLRDAEARQRIGDMAGCEAALADVERMLRP